jgi:hypothetical protein
MKEKIELAECIEAVMGRDTFDFYDNNIVSMHKHKSYDEVGLTVADNVAEEYWNNARK